MAAYKDAYIQHDALKNEYKGKSLDVYGVGHRVTINKRWKKRKPLMLVTKAPIAAWGSIW